MSTPVIDLQSVDTNTAPWGKLPIPELGVDLDVLPLVDDPDTGMSVLKLIYQAGHVTTWHTHPCAHGIYVLEGTLTTHQGSFGPGQFIWFPEGGMMQHGATPEASVTFLFIVNKPFAIDFCEGPAGE